MTPLRLLIVVPRFWPQVGESAIVAANLADELVSLGHTPTVLSARWAPEWPKSMAVREVPVLRLQHAPRGGWSSLRYMLDLTRWLRQSRNTFDAVYVLGLRHEAYATLLALGHTRIPIVLRCQEAGPNGDSAWQSLTRFGDRYRARCKSASAIVVPTATIEAELQQCGYDTRTLHRIPGGAKTRIERTADRHIRARNFLAEVNQDLATPQYSPVAVWVGKLSDTAELMPLLRAWRDIAARWPSARLWLIGDGPARSSLYSQLLDWELQYQVLMPGTFEDLEDVLLAADVYVSPQVATGQQFVMEAMAAGLPVIVADSPDARALVKHGENGMIVAAEEEHGWVGALSILCDNPSAAAKMGRASQAIAQRDFSATQMAKRHLELFDNLRLKS